MLNQLIRKNDENEERRDKDRESEKDRRRANQMIMRNGERGKETKGGGVGGEREMNR